MCNWHFVFPLCVNEKSYSRYVHASFFTTSFKQKVISVSLPYWSSVEMCLVSPIYCAL